MKIGIDARLWNQTGVGRYIRNLVRGIDDLDTSHEYYIYLLDDEFNSLKFKSKNIHKRRANIRWHTLREQILFPKVIEKDQLDLMHFTYYSVPYFYKKPYVITLHDLIIYHFMTGEASTLPIVFYRVKHLAYKFLLSQMRKNAVRIIVPLEATKQDVVKIFPQVKDKIVVTKEGFDLSFTQDNEVSNHVKRLLDEKFFLYVGNAYPHKNVKRLIESFLKLGDHRYKLVLVGKNDYFYERLREIYINENIVFLHDISDSDLSALYKNSLGLINPSLMEGFGLPVLEAMSLGSPVAASDTPAFREVCGDVAIYFNPKDDEKIFNSLKKIKDMPLEEKKHRVQQGKARAKTFSWSKMVKQTLQVYELSINELKS